MYVDPNTLISNPYSPILKIDRQNTQFRILPTIAHNTCFSHKTALNTELAIHALGGFDNALTGTVIWEYPTRLTPRTYAGSRLPDQKKIIFLFFYFIFCWDIYDCHRYPSKKKF
jgi:hypothetical protein